MDGVPGGDLVARGIADLEEGLETVPALLVSIGRARLLGLGISVPPQITDHPEHRLYRLLSPLQLQRVVATADQLRAHRPMRELTTPERLHQFIVELGRVVSEPVDVYFTGGVTAILHGWRDATVDIDLTMVPESDELLRALPRLKETLSL